MARYTFQNRHTGEAFEDEFPLGQAPGFGKPHPEHPEFRRVIEAPTVSVPRMGPKRAERITAFSLPDRTEMAPELAQLVDNWTPDGTAQFRDAKSAERWARASQKHAEKTGDSEHWYSWGDAPSGKETSQSRKTGRIQAPD